MARAAGRVAQRDVLGAADPDEVLVPGVGLDVVLHLAAKRASGVVEHPQAPHVSATVKTTNFAIAL